MVLKLKLIDIRIFLIEKLFWRWLNWCNSRILSCCFGRRLLVRIFWWNSCFLRRWSLSITLTINPIILSGRSIARYWSRFFVLQRANNRCFSVFRFLLIRVIRRSTSGCLFTMIQADTLAFSIFYYVRVLPLLVLLCHLPTHFLSQNCLLYLQVVPRTLIRLGWKTALILLGIIQREFLSELLLFLWFKFGAPKRRVHNFLVLENWKILTVAVLSWVDFLDPRVKLRFLSCICHLDYRI